MSETATIGAALKAAAARLAAGGVAEARLEARVLAGAALDLSREALLTRDGQPAAPDGLARLDALVARRIVGEPTARLLGRQEFWSLDFGLGPETLIPRADSETIIEAALAGIPDRAAPLRVLDFGTGSGCLLLALLSELPAARGLGVDASAATLAVATSNAERLGLAARAEFRQGDWGAGLAGPFDVIVSNPPYIPDADIAGLAPEVARFEPRRALAGGDDGLDCYRALAPHVARLVAADGVAVFEIGQGQADDVQRIMEAAGLRPAGRRADLAGIARALSFTR
ncbi:MAG TPA: peptide chain release factor N(5)-glutamine methyltransferase [Alphaproteobacteria bacterium]|jgi:release factor glutamine methyltransferase